MALVRAQRGSELAGGMQGSTGGCGPPCSWPQDDSPLTSSVLPVAQVAAVKAPGFGERKTSYLEDIAILTGAQVIKEELGLALDKVCCRTGSPGLVGGIRHCFSCTFSHSCIGAGGIPVAAGLG